MNNYGITNFDFIQKIIKNEADDNIKTLLGSIESKASEAERLVSINQENGYKQCFMAIDAACDDVARLYMEKILPETLKTLGKRPGKDDIWRNEQYIAGWEDNECDLKLFVELFKLKDENNSIKHSARGTIKFPITYTDENGKLLLKRDENNRIITKEITAKPEKYATLRNAEIRLENLFDYCCSVLVKCGFIQIEELPIYKEPERLATIPENVAKHLLENVEKFKKYTEADNNIERMNDIASDVDRIDVKSIKPESSVRLVSYQELIALGLTSIKIAERLVENDLNLYGTPVENEGTPELWETYLSSYPETFRYLINSENEIVGNWSFLSVSEEISHRIDEGDILESEFSIDSTEFLFFPGEYYGYLLNFSINDNYNTSENYNLLIGALADQMMIFAKQGIYFKAWYVNVFRKDHAAMYRRMGFKHQSKNVGFGDIYKLDLEERGKITPFITKEIELEYAKHFEQN